MHAQQAKTRPLAAPTKNVGADSISARARLRQDKPPRAHIECAPTDFAFNKGRQLHAGHRLCEGTLPLQKNVGADSISARARLRQGKLPRAHIECAPTDFVSDQREKIPRGAPPLRGDSAPTDLVFNIGLAGSGRYNKKRVCDILDVTDSWCAVQDSNL